MTTKTDTEQQRSEFEALEKTRFGYGKDTLVRYPTDEDEYYMPLTQARWEGYQAGRAALQSQDREDAERVTELERFIDLAFEAHPNLDLDVAALARRIEENE